MIRAALAIFAVSGFLGFAALAQEVTGMKLEESGFKMKEANTPEKMTRLKLMPARKFIRRTRNGVPYFIYADPDYCKCAYVGTQAAMNAFRGLNAPSGLPGYTGPVDTSTGNTLVDEMIADMGEDGDMPGSEDDIFNPGF